MKRLTLVYLASYLAVGGVGLLFVPDLALSLLFSDGEYGDVMPRVVGMFMLVLSLLVTRFVHRGDYSYYATTIVARTFIVAVLVFLYFRSNDPLFLVLTGIVLLGLLPAMYVQFVGTGASVSKGHDALAGAGLIATYATIPVWRFVSSGVPVDNRTAQP